MVGNEVGQIAVLAMIPNLFGRIEVGRVAGEPLKLEPCWVKVLEMLRRGAVDGVPIPDQDHLATEVSMHLREKPNHVVRPNIVRQQLKVQLQGMPLGRNGNGRDRRKPIVPIPSVLDRRLPGRGPRSAPDRLHHEPAFVEKHDASLLCGPPFLIRGQSFRRKASMAASSRSRARCSGF